MWVMGPPAVARCKVGPSQCHSHTTPSKMCVCWPCVFSKSWLHMVPAPALSALGSPGQELVGAGGSAAMLSKGCCARCRSRARSSSCASQSRQQLRSVHSSPGLWPGSPPHACQDVVKLRLQPMAPRKNLCGFRSHKCQRGLCWPQGPPDPSDQGGCGSWPGSGLPCLRSRAASPHTWTSVWLCGAPDLVPLNTAPRAGLPASRASESWAWPLSSGGPLCPLCPSVVPWHCSVPCAGGGRGAVVQQPGCGWVEGSAEWMGPSQECSQLLPPSLFTVSAPR